MKLYNLITIQDVIDVIQETVNISNNALASVGNIVNEIGDFKPPSVTNPILSRARHVIQNHPHRVLITSLFAIIEICETRLLVTVPGSLLGGEDEKTTVPLCMLVSLHDEVDSIIELRQSDYSTAPANVRAFFHEVEVTVDSLYRVNEALSTYIDLSRNKPVIDVLTSIPSITSQQWFVIALSYVQTHLPVKTRNTASSYLHH